MVNTFIFIIVVDTLVLSPDSYPNLLLMGVENKTKQFLKYILVLNPPVATSLA